MRCRIPTLEKSHSSLACSCRKSLLLNKAARIILDAGSEGGQLRLAPRRLKKVDMEGVLMRVVIGVVGGWGVNYNKKTGGNICPVHTARCMQDGDAWGSEMAEEAIASACIWRLDLG